jgi:hypothetical protein
MNSRLGVLAKRFELRALATRLRLAGLLHRQRSEVSTTGDGVAEWMTWIGAASAPEGRRRVMEQLETDAQQLIDLQVRHEAEQKNLETMWLRLDETARLLNRAASRRARRSIETGGEE